MTVSHTHTHQPCLRDAEGDAQLQRTHEVVAAGWGPSKQRQG